jgi:hypothetical protein
MSCPGSIAAERDAPPSEETSSFADEGTKVHALFARCLIEGRAAPPMVDDPLILRPLALALDLTRRIPGPRRFLTEMRLRPLPGLPEVWGTSDLIGFSAAGPVDIIVDLKFGAGLVVEADEVQVGIYALLAGHAYGTSPDGVTAWVVQPRCDHPDGPARSYHYSPAALRALEAALRSAAALTSAPAAPRRAGPWCRFCAAAGTCPTKEQAPDALPHMPSALFRPGPRWFAVQRGAHG